MDEFNKIIKVLDSFNVPEIKNEYSLEQDIMKHLKNNKITVKNQVRDTHKRYDIICYINSKKICIELKQKIKSKDIEQLDNYIRMHDGLIVLCWVASKPVRDIFKSVKQQSPKPTELIELCKRCYIA